jgi:hypothetical protein
VEARDSDFGGDLGGGESDCFRSINWLWQQGDRMTYEEEKQQNNAP